MKYEGTRLRDDIVITELVTVHYYEFAKDYVFPGERHEWWELVYIDKGELTAVRDNDKIKLVQGDILFHKPNEWHSIIADGKNSSCAIIISFKCNSASMSSFKNMLFYTGTKHRNLLSGIIDECREAFDTPVGELDTTKLHRRKNSKFGCEQLLKMYLCELLITLLRKESSPKTNIIKRNLDDSLFSEIVLYMEKSIGKKLSLNEIARYAGISKTALKQLFREQAGCGACEYFIRMKIDTAKKLIRERNYNFTQISEILGYESIHYFSRQFRLYVNMSPSEYAASVIALSDKAASYNAYEKEND